MNDLTTKKEALTPEQIALVKRTVANGIGEDEFAMFMYLAKQYDLDPFLKEICVIKRRVYNSYKRDYDEVVSIMTTRDGFLSIGHKSGKFGGMESDVIKDDKGNLDGAWCKVWNKSFGTQPVTVKVKFSEYCVYIKDSKTQERKPQALWGSKPETMIKKVAESQALRKAFNIKGIYSEEELEAEIKGSAKTELEYMKDGIKITEALNDPNVYEKWAEETLTKMLDEIAACETDKGLSQIRRSHEKDIGQMMDEDRSYINDMLDSRLQQIVSDSTPRESILKEVPADVDVTKPVTGSVELQGKKKTIEEEMSEQESHSQSFGQEYVGKINACITKAQLNLLKASTLFITGRAKCNQVMKEYIDATLKARYGKLVT